MKYFIVQDYTGARYRRKVPDAPLSNEEPGGCAGDARLPRVQTLPPWCRAVQYLSDDPNVRCEEGDWVLSTYEAKDGGRRIHFMQMTEESAGSLRTFFRGAKDSKSYLISRSDPAADA